MKKISLENLGLTRSEEKTYLALLELGDTTRAKIVKETQIAGSKIYDVLERLQKKGLVSIYLKDKIKHFKPLNPKQLINFIKEKEKKIIEEKRIAESLLPQLLAQFSSSKQEQEVELLTGLKSINVYFQEQIEDLEKEETNYVIGGTQGNNDKHIVAFFRRIHKKREEKGIITKMLYNKRQEKTAKKEYGSKEFPNTETKFIQHSSAVSINIHKNKALLMIFGKETIGIKITSQEIANSFLEYFNIMWKSAK